MSGGLGNFRAVSGRTERIFSFKQRVCLCKDPFRNVVKHLKQCEPVSDKNSFSRTYIEGAQMPQLITMQPASPPPATALPPNTGPV